MLNERIRPDHRAFDEIRAVTVEVGVLPRVHGSALFTRGETQALVTATLGTTDDAQRMESYEGEQKRRFMLHYNFPPFSVGEVGRMTGVGRREIGHGALASRAIEAVLPGEEESPYTLRVVSDILESNGSSSMATVCGASLALMQAGIPHQGLRRRRRDGPGEGRRQLRHPLRHRRRGRSLRRHGLQGRRHAQGHHRPADGHQDHGHHRRRSCARRWPRPSGAACTCWTSWTRPSRRAREEKSQFAPRIHTIQIPTDKIRDLIGPGGKVIRGIIDATGVKIDVDDTGRVNVASSDADGLARAIQMISDITAVPEIGKTYLGKVVRIAEFGAFVEIFPGTDGLLHVSEIAEHRVKEVKDELREGDQILVKVLAIEGNRIKLSRKAVLREQRAKLGLDAAAPEGGESSDGGRGQGRRSAPPAPAADFDGEEDDDSEVLLEGGADFDDDEADDVDDEGGEETDSDAEPNFNRADPVPAGAPAGGGRGPGGDRGPGRGPGGGGRGPGGGGRGPGGGGGRRRRSGRRPGAGGGGGGSNPGGGNR